MGANRLSLLVRFGVLLVAFSFFACRGPSNPIKGNGSDTTKGSTTGSPPTCCEQLPSQEKAIVEIKDSNDLFDVCHCIYTKKIENPQFQYSQLVAEFKEVNSAEGIQNRKIIWNRFLSAFWEKSKAASFSVQIVDDATKEPATKPAKEPATKEPATKPAKESATKEPATKPAKESATKEPATKDGAKKLLLYTIFRDPTSDIFEQVTGKWYLSPPRLQPLTSTMSVKVSVQFLDEAKSKIAKIILEAVKIAVGVVGGAPATELVNKIPKDTTDKMDNFLGTMGKSTKGWADTISITDEDLSTNSHYEVRFYDGKKNDPQRKVVFILTLKPRLRRSLFLTELPLSNESKKQYNCDDILHNSLDGKEAKDVFTLIKNDDVLYPLYLGEKYSSYFYFCKSLPVFLGKQGFSHDDVIIVKHALLFTAKGGGKRQKTDADVCPDDDTVALMNDLKLPDLPSSKPTPDRDEIDKSFNKISTALATRRGFEGLCRGIVNVCQSVALFPETTYPLKEPRGIASYEIEKSFSDLKVPADGRCLGQFDYNNEGERSGTAQFRVPRQSDAQGETFDRYNIRFVLDTDYKVQSMFIDPAK